MTMNRNRIFIAINLPSEIKQELISYQRKWQDLPVRWTKKENLHLTLIFLGYIADDELLEILEKTRKIVKSHQSFLMYFNKIYLGPPDKTPRMFWVEGQKSEELFLLKKELEEEMGEAQSKRGGRGFRLHITLGRIKMIEWQRLQKKPKVEEDISITVPVNSIEVMESHLKPDGPDYLVLESIPLENKL
jgi:2'-5' RNA ligase